MLSSGERSDEPEEIASRILRLRKVLRELRHELYRERLSLQREHCWPVFCSRESRYTGDAEEFICSSNFHRRHPSSLSAFEPTWSDSIDLELDLEVANFYKSKIREIEADCCAGLGEIRTRFTASSSDLLENPSTPNEGEDSDTNARDQRNSKSMTAEVETLWKAIGDPYNADELSGLMNETSRPDERLPSETYQELMIPSDRPRQIWLSEAQ